MDQNKIILEVQRRVEAGERIYAPVMSNSMEPLLLTGELCYIEKFPLHALKPGMIIAVIHGQQMIWHHYIKSEHGLVFTKALNATSVDPASDCSLYIGRVFTVRKRLIVRHFRSTVEFLKRLLRLSRDVLSSILIFLLISLRHSRIIKNIWTAILSRMRKILAFFIDKYDLGILHFHTRYAKKEVIPFSSDVDFTLILPSTCDPKERLRLFKKRSLWLKRCIQYIPFLDHPYIFFEDEIDDVSATSIFMKNSFDLDSKNSPLQSLLRSVHLNTNKNVLHVGYLDEIFSLVKRFQKIQSPVPFLILRKEKRLIELQKLAADLEVLQRLINDNVMLEVNQKASSRSEIKVDDSNLEKFIATNLISLSQQILSDSNYNQHVELDPIDLDLDRACSMILRSYLSIDRAVRPVTLHLSQYVRNHTLFV